MQAGCHVGWQLGRPQGRKPDRHEGLQADGKEGRKAGM